MTPYETRKYPPCTGTASCYTCYIHGLLWGEALVEKMQDGTRRHINPKDIQRIYDRDRYRGMV